MTHEAKGKLLPKFQPSLLPDKMMRIEALALVEGLRHHKTRPDKTREHTLQWLAENDFRKFKELFQYWVDGKKKHLPYVFSIVDSLHTATLCQKTSQNALSLEGKFQELFLDMCRVLRKTPEGVDYISACCIHAQLKNSIDKQRSAVALDLADVLRTRVIPHKIALVLVSLAEDFCEQAEGRPSPATTCSTTPSPATVFSVPALLQSAALH
jgi:hypothetical protein